MAIKYRPCVINSGSVFWLPLPILDFSDSVEQKNDIRDIPNQEGATVISSKRGVISISISGQILGYSSASGVIPGYPDDALVYSMTSTRNAENAQNIKRIMQGAMSGGAITQSSPFSGTFTLFRWNDRGYLRCVCNRMEFKESNKSPSIIPYTLDITCCGGYLDGTDSVSANSDWQQFIGNKSNDNS